MKLGYVYVVLVLKRRAPTPERNHTHILSRIDGEDCFP